jgi:hypothetical protein
MRDERVRLGDLPQEILGEAFALIRYHSTAFITDQKLAGSGTFVRIAGNAGILTAQHVWEHVLASAKNARLGLQITDERHEFLVDFDKLIPRLNITRRTNAFGPDLQFIELPAQIVGAIEARKSFYDISHRSRTKHESANAKFGFIIVSGFPRDRTGHLVDSIKRTRVLKLFGLGMVVGRDRIRRQGGFDFWEMETEAKDETDVYNYQGVSGGGVWRVVLKKKAGADFSTATVDDVYLAGVAFYQSRVRNGWRFVRSHGPDAIYKHLPCLLAKKPANRPHR